MTSWTTLSLDGRRGFVLIPGRYPPIRHFLNIAGEYALETLDAVEAMTDQQARDEIGQIELVPVSERYRGSNAGLVMAPFTAADSAGNLFSDGSYGVSYLEMLEPVAIAEAQRRFADFLAATGEQPTRLRLGLYSFGLSGNAADLRACADISWKGLTQPGNAASRRLGARLRAAGMAAALYPNALDNNEESLAVFSPAMFVDCTRNALVELNWNGRTFDDVSVIPSLTGVRKLNEFKWRTKSV